MIPGSFKHIHDEIDVIFDNMDESGLSIATCNEALRFLNPLFDELNYQTQIFSFKDATQEIAYFKGPWLSAFATLTFYSSIRKFLVLPFGSAIHQKDYRMQLMDELYHFFFHQ